MKETFIYQKYLPTLQSYGVPSRIETSTQGGFPDFVYLVDGKTLFIELKQTTTRFINLGKFQVSWHTRAERGLNPWHDWFWVEQKGVVRCFTWSTLKNAPSLYKENVGVKYSIGSLSEDFTLHAPKDVLAWLDHIKEHEND